MIEKQRWRPAAAYLRSDALARRVVSRRAPTSAAPGGFSSPAVATRTLVLARASVSEAW